MENRGKKRKEEREREKGKEREKICEQSYRRNRHPKVAILKRETIGFLILLSPSLSPSQKEEGLGCLQAADCRVYLDGSHHYTSQTHAHSHMKPNGCTYIYIHILYIYIHILYIYIYIYIKYN